MSVCFWNGNVLFKTLRSLWSDLAIPLLPSLKINWWYIMVVKSPNFKLENILDMIEHLSAWSVPFCPSTFWNERTSEHACLQASTLVEYPAFSSIYSGASFYWITSSNFWKIMTRIMLIWSLLRSMKNYRLNYLILC